VRQTSAAAKNVCAGGEDIETIQTGKGFLFAVLSGNLELCGCSEQRKGPAVSGSTIF